MLDVNKTLKKSTWHLDTDKLRKSPSYINKYNSYRLLSFTPREIDILESLSVGMKPDSIAESLFLSHHTIKTHIRNMLKKSGCTNSVVMIANALRAGVIT